MNKKNYFIFAAAIALASCSVDEYMGENPEFTQTTKENIIGFGGGTGSMSRVTQNTGTTEQMLDNQFLVYGWKTTTTGTQKVFDNYWVWYEGTNKTPSNPDATNSNAEKGWEYVGNSGTQMPFKDTDGSNKTLGNTQTIKYWDYSATDYRFVAGSPIKSFTFNKAADNIAIATATVKDLGGHINPNDGSTTKIDPDPVYLAKPKVIKKVDNKYGSPVQFDFVRLQTKVRVGIYETIPGYSISSISFYKQKDDGTGLEVESDVAKKNNIILTSTGEKFYGGASVTGTVTYDWNATPNPSFTYSYSYGITAAYNWYGGKFQNGVKATSSNPSEADAISNLYGSDGDMSTTGYFTVIPNHNDQAIVIKCDYTLTSEDGNETINVTGATAAIPAEYCKWEENKMYTYIFKISQETNGTTGTIGDPEGLFPITFDATAIEENNSENQQGTVTIINAPSITTHQAGSVTNNGIEYKTGTQIDITVKDENNTLQPLNTTESPISKGYIAVYKFTGEKTEADLTVSGISGGTKVTNLTLSPVGTDPNKKASFTPNAEGYYAIQYCYKNSSTPVYKYKVIEVKAASGS